MPLFKCKLKRAGGTKIEIGGTHYHFAESTHTCVVENPEHAARLMQIPEAYELVEPRKAAPAPDPEPAAEAAPATIDVDSMDKESLIAFAQDTLGLKLDGRKSVEALRGTVSAKMRERGE